MGASAEMVEAKQHGERVNIVKYVLLSDLHMPHAGDGFTVVSPIGHTHPRA
jgi:hypothetical protein